MLLALAADLRAKTWKRQRELGVTIVPSNDFSLYDHVLDTTAMVGAAPSIYGSVEGPVSLDDLFRHGARRAGAMPTTMDVLMATRMTAKAHLPRK